MQTLNGQCLCGAVAFSVTAKAPEVWVCHCEMCRHWTSGGMLALPAESLSIVNDSTLRWYESSAWGERGFCSTCGSSLFWRGRGPAADHLAVSAGSLDAQDMLLLKGHIFVDEKPAYYDFSGDAERLTGAEVLAGFD